MKLCIVFCAFVLLMTMVNFVTSQATDTEVIGKSSSKCPQGYEKTSTRCTYNYQCKSGVGICKAGRCCEKKKNPHKGQCPRDYRETNKKCRSDYDCGYDGICKKKRCCEMKKNPNKNNCPRGFKETNRQCKNDYDCGYDGICKKKRCCKPKKR